MTTDLEDWKIPPKLTPIQKFYEGKNVFITGVTGFCGQILLEKLLRSCPKISKIYILLREKKGKEPNTRLGEILDSVIFSKLQNEMPNFREKLEILEGDCSSPDLGLNMQNRQMLINNVHVIFHVAATVRLNESLKVALSTNVRASQDLVTMATKMQKLKVMIYVSTAYSQCIRPHIEEKIYSHPHGAKNILQLAETVDEELLKKITPVIVDEWPNTYVYTKALAEKLINQEGTKLPIGIFRPSIVTSTYKEPIPGWINNFYGPIGISSGVSLGIIRVVHCDDTLNANIVPVDMCINALIAASWEVAKNFENENISEASSFSDLPVYHYESSNDQPITWYEFGDLLIKHGLKIMSIKAVWYPGALTKIKYRPLYLLAAFFVHYIPAFIADMFLFCIGKTTWMVALYKKIHLLFEIGSRFCTRQWSFESHRLTTLLSKMSEEDKEIFYYDLKQLDWNEYWIHYMIGLRIYLVKDPLETIDAGQIKLKRLIYLHYGFKLIIGFIILYILWILLA